MMMVKDLRLSGRESHDNNSLMTVVIEVNNRESDKYELQLTRREFECLLAEIQDVVQPYTRSNKRRVTRFFNKGTKFG